MQSSGYMRSSFNPYLEPLCVMYGYMISRTTCGSAISHGSSPSLIIYSKRQSRFDGTPKRPQTDGLLILQIKRKSYGKNSSKTC